VDRNGQGLLLANATAAARLNPSGVVIAKGLLDGEGEEALLRRLSGSFQGVTRDRAKDDIARVRRLIADLESPGDNYPILNLTEPLFTAGAVSLEKPLSADVPLAEPERLVPILDRLWELGIPHVTFIASEGAEPRAWVRAVERAEDLGMIAGVRARGSDLTEGSLIRDLAQAGVDHFDILYLSKEPEVHDSLAGAGDHERAVKAFAEACENEVCAVADVVLVRPTLSAVEEILEGFTSLGVRNAGFVALATPADQESAEALKPDELVQAAELIEESADELGARLLWYPPVRFDVNIALAEQVRRGRRCSGDTAVRVEPNGSVIPARGPFQPAGNLLIDDWEKIRDHEVYRKYRQRIETDTHCAGCPGLAICAADCPRDPEGWAK
jgi:radical SAM protein with 4Fe4S-binding SPASM domain